ncbi:MAG: hypothetical protein JXC36_07275 [Candidatus Atribacteria bacterium]|nr:hypothetical protein [Candidatus Atribacteria bacterium]
MDNTNVDNFTKEIISGSKLELSNPDFNKTLMDRIKTQNQKRIIYSNIKLYSFLFLTIDIAIIALLNLTGIRFSDIALKISFINRGFENFYSNPEQLTSIYFAVLFTVILMIKLFSRTGYSYLKTHEG